MCACYIYTIIYTILDSSQRKSRALKKGDKRGKTHIENADLPSQGEDDVDILSESFNKTVQDWKKLRNKQSPEDGKLNDKFIDTGVTLQSTYVKKSNLNHQGAFPEVNNSETHKKSESRERDRSNLRRAKERQKIERKEHKLKSELEKLAQQKMRLDLLSSCGGRDEENLETVSMKMDTNEEINSVVESKSFRKCDVAETFIVVNEAPDDEQLNEYPVKIRTFKKHQQPQNMLHRQKQTRVKYGIQQQEDIQFLKVQTQKQQSPEHKNRIESQGWNENLQSLRY